jgi:hypothetical protein
VKTGSPNRKEGVFFMLEQGYGIMPNKVLKDKTISSTSKLVFCLISSLTAQSGACHATNKYIGDQIGIKNRQVAYCIKQLSEYIICEMVTSEKREIKLVDNYRQKMHTPMQKNAYPHAKNNIHNNIKEYYKYNKGKPVEKPISTKEYFDKFYPDVRKPSLV